MGEEKVEMKCGRDHLAHGLGSETKCQHEQMCTERVLVISIHPAAAHLSVTGQKQQIQAVSHAPCCTEAKGSRSHSF